MNKTSIQDFTYHSYRKQKQKKLIKAKIAKHLAFYVKISRKKMVNLI